MSTRPLPKTNKDGSHVWLMIVLSILAFTDDSSTAQTERDRRKDDRQVVKEAKERVRLLSKQRRLGEHRPSDQKPNEQNASPVFLSNLRGSPVQVGSLAATSEEQMAQLQVPPIILNNVQGSALANGSSAGLSSFGAAYTVDPTTFHYYYQQQGGLQIEVQTADGKKSVLSEFDAYCLNNKNSRTTLHNFVCKSAGFPHSLEANTAYRMRLHQKNLASSKWYHFTTPGSNIGGL